MRTFWEFCILNEHEILQEINNEMNDDGARPSGGGHSGISKPTEIKAIRNLTKVVRVVKIFNRVTIDYPWDVINAIRYVRARVNLNKELGAIYQARFIYKEDSKDTCKRLHITPPTYNKRVWKIVNMCEKQKKVIAQERKRNRNANKQY